MRISSIKPLSASISSSIKSRCIKRESSSSVSANISTAKRIRATGVRSSCDTARVSSRCDSIKRLIWEVMALKVAAKRAISSWPITCTWLSRLPLLTSFTPTCISCNLRSSGKISAYTPKLIKNILIKIILTIKFSGNQLNKGTGPIKIAISLISDGTMTLIDELLLLVLVSCNKITTSSRRKRAIWSGSKLSAATALNAKGNENFSSNCAKRARLSDKVI